MKTIAVIFGGRSTEHDVSIVTAISSIIRPLEALGTYNIEPIYISKEGQWIWDKRLKDIRLFQSNDINDLIKRSPKVQVQFDGGMTIVKSSQFAGRKQYRKVDIVFPAMHGIHGEDGELMGLLEMANVPYVGCDMFASVVAMDKILAKQVAESNGIATTPWIWTTDKELAVHHDDVKKRLKNLKLPLFVKPARLGSSIGISKVEDISQLDNALEVATHYDSRVLIEQAVNNLIEVTLPIIGNAEPFPALLERPLLRSGDFFDFDAKYISGGKKGTANGKQGAQGYSQIPADIPKDLYEKATKLGLEVYKVIGCRGLARVDMLIDSKSKQVFFNEVNPLPGSLYQHNWNMAGISSVELVDKLIHFAEEDWLEKQKKTVTFSASFLKQF